MPTCSVHEHDCMSFCVNLFADFVEVQLYGFGISSWQDQSSADTTLWTDGPEQFDLCEYLNRYTYLPRLKGREPL